MTSMITMLRAQLLWNILNRNGAADDKDKLNIKFRLIRLINLMKEEWSTLGFGCF